MPKKGREVVEGKSTWYSKLDSHLGMKMNITIAAMVFHLSLYDLLLLLWKQAWLSLGNKNGDKTDCAKLLKISFSGFRFF